MWRVVPDPSPDEPRRLVCLIGDWPALPVAAAGAEHRQGTFRLRQWPGPRGLDRVLDRWQPEWLLLGDVSDAAADQLIALLSALDGTRRPRLAVLGPAHDDARCRWWIRRGCAVYLASSSGVQRVLGVIQAASRLRTVIIDEVFLPAEAERMGAGQPALTRREREVLRELCLGLRNRDIAAALHIAESTVEFHVKRLLAKLGARNRADVVRRAIALGLEDPSAA